MDWGALETTLHPVPGIIGRLGHAFDAGAICDKWPRSYAKRSRAYSQNKRKNWRGVPLIYRFLASIRFGTPSDCWEWQRNLSRGGYGVIWSDGRERKATHLALEYEGRQRPSPQHNALHSCDNPRCCNPRHLRWGTQRENSIDMMARGRGDQRGIAIAHRKQREDPYCRSGRHLLAETGKKGTAGRRYCGECHKERRRARHS